MELFEMVLNPSTIYNTLFLDVKWRLKYKNVEDLKEGNSVLFDFFVTEIYDKKSGYDIDDYYSKFCINYGEFCDIITITYGTLELTPDGPKRMIKHLTNKNEAIMVRDFFDLLNTAISDEFILCGYNIKNIQIPFLIKKFLYYRDQYVNIVKFPIILKKYLNSKPWDNHVVDINDVWKFNGIGKSPLNVVSNCMGFDVSSVEVLSQEYISKYYWKCVMEKSEYIKDIEYQSMYTVNLIMRFMKDIRNV